MPTTVPTDVPSASRPGWRWSDVAWLTALVLAAYFLRAADLPLRGEEPTRAQVAFEMIESGDWVVPREQGEPFLIRPPLQNWLIAASSLVLGRRDAVAVRLPSLVATLLTTLLVYGYSRTFLSRTGALAAGLAFATTGEMLQTGRLAETEALFILLLSASLLVWHWGVVRNWPAFLAWGAGYGLMALAALTKGPQAPAYFLGSVFLYLAVTRQWRRLFSGAHAAGALVGAAVVGAWLVPLALSAGLPAAYTAWLGDPATRMQAWTLRDVLVHAAEYPFIIFGCTLPWSPLLFLYLHPAVRARRPQLLFCGICLAVAFPSCWLHPGGQSRYFTPLYPCLAVLVGWAVECCAAAEPSSWPGIARARYLAAAAAIVLGAAALVPAVALMPNVPALAPWTEPLPVALTYSAASAVLAVLILRARRAGGAAGARTAVLAVAWFLVMTSNGPVTNARVRRAEDAPAAMSRLKQRLPPCQQLVSLGGHTDSLFAYLYGFPVIRSRPWPVSERDVGPELTYFAFVAAGDHRPRLPFAWEEIGAVSVDRNHHEPPERVVVVGRRKEKEGRRGEELGESGEGAGSPPVPRPLLAERGTE